jgi:hypothetical protein
MGEIVEGYSLDSTSGLSLLLEPRLVHIRGNSDEFTGLSKVGSRVVFW